MLELCRELTPADQDDNDVTARRGFPECEAHFRHNGANFFSTLDGGAPMFEQLLIDLFRTEFHVTLLWGSGSGVQEFPRNFETRHSKFARVVATLAAICNKS